mgnify:CR=1 FL=1
MKKLIASLIPCAALALASCGDSNYELHQTFFSPLKANGMEFFADQQSDTIHLLSLDSWTLASTASWMQVSPTSKNIPQYQSADTRLDITTDINNTGSTRIAYINVTSNVSPSMPVIQRSWLNITQPTVFYTNADKELTKQATFPLMLKAAANDTTIVFKVYQDGATLSSSADWITPDSTSFKKGRHEIKVTYTGNNTNAKRNATLTLTSAGVSTDIIVTQDK